ncbi:augurin isoform X1 [Spea bombifrons]|uniref:augurin isoform X1 n=2 Tax=Spea bombifrons TaxID=233779 RepID=UPI00234BF90E|nr:augurin isoform X1 [Spea bombifrons]
MYRGNRICAKKMSTSREKRGLLPQYTIRRFGLTSVVLVFLLVIFISPELSSGNKLRMMLQKREASAPAKTVVAVEGNKANEFLNTLKRPKRQLWDRTRPEVQQWYQQFLYMGFDEAKYEDDMSYWKNQGRGGSEYYGGFHQHHYDEDSAIGPRNPYTFRHGAGVNYDDY